MVEPCCNTYATVVRVHPIVYSTGYTSGGIGRRLRH
nr:MAG TPA: hypothetical protein [Caudoviricetes sp.]